MEVGPATRYALRRNNASKPILGLFFAVKFRTNVQIC